MAEHSALVNRAKLAYARRNRERKLAFAIDFARQADVKTILLIGVAGGPGIGRTAEEWAIIRIVNIIESGLLDAGFVVTASGLEETAAGWDNYVQADALDLPFPDKSFDLVYSNAVIEHVGGVPEQRQFVAEHQRVGKHWIFTTPNRLFPVESHSNVLFKHWRDEWMEQSPLFTRLLRPKDVRALLTNGGVLRDRPWSPTLTVTCHEKPT